VDSALVENIFALWLAVLLISMDLSSSAEVIEMKSSIANNTLVQLVTFRITYLSHLFAQNILKDKSKSIPACS